MSKVVYVREDLVYQLKKWCDTHTIKIIGAPFECDPQLVGDELSCVEGVTASLIVASDFFALGSKIMIDCLDLKTGRCHIIKRNEIFEQGILCDAENENEPYDMAIYASFVGCDFIGHSFGQSERVVDIMMTEWNKLETIDDRKAYLDHIAETKRWKRGDVGFASDYH